MADPLSESTYQRRLWAAYLAAGYNRASFARALGIQYAALDAWDRGATPRLEAFARAAKLVGFTIDQLYYGRAGAPATSEPSAPPPMIAAALDSVEATPRERRAVPADAPHSYYEKLAAAYTEAKAAGMAHAAAFGRALIEAEQARAFGEAVPVLAAGGRPITAAALVAAGKADAATSAARARKPKVQRSRR